MVMSPDTKKILSFITLAGALVLVSRKSKAEKPPLPENGIIV